MKYQIRILRRIEQSKQAESLRSCKIFLVAIGQLDAGSTGVNPAQKKDLTKLFFLIFNFLRTRKTYKFSKKFAPTKKITQQKISIFNCFFSISISSKQEKKFKSEGGQRTEAKQRDTDLDDMI